MSAGFFDRLARRYDRTFAPSHSVTAADLEGLLRDVPHVGIALDVGCGTGRAWSALLSHGLRVVAIDASSAMLAEAGRRSSAERVARIRSDLYAPWPIAGRSVDLVLMLHAVLAHPPGDDEVAWSGAWRSVGSEIRRVGKPGARVVIDLPEPAWAHRHLATLGGDRYLHREPDGTSIVAVIPEPAEVLEALGFAEFGRVDSPTGIRAVGNHGSHVPPSADP